MIIVEMIQELICLILRFVVWIFTARDCNHCRYHYVFYGTECCNNPHLKECINTITRKHFERKRRGNDG